MDYDDILDELCVDKISEEVVNNNYGKSVEEICFLIDQEYSKYKSEIWFPNDRILIHPSIKTRRAAKYYETVNGIIIRRFKTLEENNIGNGSVIVVNIYIE